MTADEAELEQRGDEGFLQRWSRRKQGAEGQADPPESDLAEVVGADTERTEPKPLTDADMPPLESLTEESDFSGFLSSGVSEELRRMALRKLFHSAVFNVRDGLSDYDEDFTSFEKLGDIVTAEMRHRAEQEARRLAEAVEAADGDQADAVNELADDAAHGSEAASLSDQSEPAPVGSVDETEAADLQREPSEVDQPESGR